ncbi:unnamed protein product, partial [Polarella glacialis]
DAVIKARNELQLAVVHERHLPRIVRADTPRAIAIANLCEGPLNLPGATRRIVEALGGAKNEEFEQNHMQALEKKFKFKGYIDRIENRAITVGQLRRVIKFCQASCHQWRDAPEEEEEEGLRVHKVSPRTAAQMYNMGALTLYHINRWLISPATEGNRCSFVELVAEQAQPADWFVSHFWGQPHASFVRCVEGHLATRALHRGTGFWIWAYAQRQHATEAIEANVNTFKAAMALAEYRVLLVLQDMDASSIEQTVLQTVFHRLWCAFEINTCLSGSMSRGFPRAPVDIAACVGDQGRLITYDLTTEEEGMERRVAGSGLAAKSEREKGFPLGLVKAALEHNVQTAQVSWAEDRIEIFNALVNRKEKELVLPPAELEFLCSKVNAKLNGLYALCLLRKVSEEHDPASLVDVDVEGLKLSIAQCLRGDVERTELDVSMGGGSGISVNEELFVLVRNLPPKLKKVALDMKGSGLKNQSLAELANFLPTDLEDITIDLQGCRGINDSGLKRFMDNLMENCSDRSKLKILSCYLFGTKVEEGCQEVCENLDLEMIQQVRHDAELQERKNYIKRLMKNISQGKLPIISLRKLLERDTEVTVWGTLGEAGLIDASHVTWDIHSKDMEITIDAALLKVLLDHRAALLMSKAAGKAPYSVMWPVPDQQAVAKKRLEADPAAKARVTTEQRANVMNFQGKHYEVSHRHKQMHTDKFADALRKAEPEGTKAIAEALLELRTGDLVQVSVPILSETLATALVYAAREGELAAISALLDIGKCSKLLGQADKEEWEDDELQDCGLLSRDDAPSGTALMGAAEFGHHEVVSKFVDYGADIHAQHHINGMTPLTAAARKGHIEVMNLLLDNGADAESRVDEPRRTPLNWAAMNGHIAIVQMLLQKHAVHVDLYDLKGLTPLMHAARIGHVVVAQKLLEFNANVKAVDKDGKTSMQYAAIFDSDKLALQQKKQKIQDMLRIALEEAGPDPEEKE